MIHIAIVEDNAAYQEAIQLYFKQVADVEVVYATAGLHDLPDLLRAAPDVVIMDIDLGKDSGIWGVQQIKEASPATGILILTVFEDEEKIFQSIKAGASGYLLKKDSPEKIAEAVRSLYNGEAAINGQVARKILNAFPQPSAIAPGLDGYNLTKREKEIISLLIEGLSYKEIAANCYISIDTLNSHIRNIYTKLNIHSRAEIAAHFRPH